MEFFMIPMIVQETVQDVFMGIGQDLIKNIIDIKN